MQIWPAGSGGGAGAADLAGGLRGDIEVMYDGDWCVLRQSNLSLVITRHHSISSVITRSSPSLVVIRHHSVTLRYSTIIHPPLQMCNHHPLNLQVHASAVPQPRSLLGVMRPVVIHSLSSFRIRLCTLDPLVDFLSRRRCLITKRKRAAALSFGSSNHNALGSHEIQDPIVLYEVLALRYIFLLSLSPRLFSFSMPARLRWKR